MDVGFLGCLFHEYKLWFLNEGRKWQGWAGATVQGERESSVRIKDKLLHITHKVHSGKYYGILTAPRDKTQVAMSHVAGFGITGSLECV